MKNGISHLDLYNLLKSFLCTQLFAEFEYVKFSGLANTVVFLDHEKRVRDYFEYFQVNKSGRAMDKATQHMENELFEFVFFFYYF